MAKAGVGIGFHSHTHRNYGRLPLPEVTADAEQGLALLEREVRLRPASFAFPYGHHGSYSRKTIAVLQQRGLGTFFTTELGRSPLTSDQPISRFVIHPEDEIQSFRRKLYGGYDWVGRVRRFAYFISDFIAE